MSSRTQSSGPATNLLRAVRLPASFRSAANRIATAITITAMAVVFAWSLRPMSGVSEYRATGGRPSLRSPTAYEGFAGAEPWGRWTTASEASIAFGRALPRRFEAVLRARAFGPNVGIPVPVCAGQDCRTTTLAADDTDIRLSFTTDGGVRSLRILVPRPTNPDGPDERPLGVGVVSIRIEEVIG